MSDVGKIGYSPDYESRKLSAEEKLSILATTFHGVKEELNQKNIELQAMAEMLAEQLTILAEYHGVGTCPNYIEMNEALQGYEEWKK